MTKTKIAIPSSYSKHNITSMGRYPYFDFIKISKRVNGFDRSYLTKISESRFKLHGDYTDLDIYYSQRYKVLTLSGSLAWYSQGHNLFFDQWDFKRAVYSVSSKLDTNMFESGVKEVEVSRIIPVDRPVIEIQNNLLDLKGFEDVMKQNTLYYNKYNRGGKREIVLKFYDVVKNAKAKKMTFQPEGNILKYEIKLFNPTKLFGYAITVHDLVFDEEIIDKIYSEMGHHYENINKGKKTYTTGSHRFVDIVIAEIISKYPDLIKSIRRRIDSLPLSANAKHKRRELLKEKISHIGVEDSPYYLQL